MSNRVVLISGPPKSGKDTLARLLHDFFAARSLSAAVEKFATALRQDVIDALRLPYTVADIEGPMKDMPLLSKSWSVAGRALPTVREALIAFSERFIKPLLGADHYGHRLLRTLASHPPGTVLLISDSGFRAEAQPLLAHYGAANVAHVHVHRPGCDFSRDSRSFWRSPEIPLWIELRNNGTADQLAELIETVTGPRLLRWIEQSDAAPVHVHDVHDVHDLEHGGLGL